MPEVTDVVDAQVEAYFARDLERFVACYAPDVLITNAAGDVMAKGHDGLREMYGGSSRTARSLLGESRIA